MAAGTTTYMGLGVPLYGESTLTQTTGATDILSIKGGNNQTGDFLNALDSTATKRFSVEDGGNVIVTQKAAADVGLKILRASTPTVDALQITANDGVATSKAFRVSKNYNPVLRIFTTKPTTGLTKGELYCLFHGSRPMLAVCTSTATSVARLIRLRTKSNGRLTA